MSNKDIQAYIQSAVDRNFARLPAEIAKLQPEKEPRRPTTWSYSRAIGLPATLLAVAAMLMPECFWPAVFLISIVAAAFVYDLWFDSNLRFPAKLLFSAIVLSSVGYWLPCKVVWRPDPFEKSVIANSIPQVDGKNIPIENIQFKPEVAILELSIVNGSQAD
jgi:hypothetical protein